MVQGQVDLLRQVAHGELQRDLTLIGDGEPEADRLPRVHYPHLPKLGLARQQFAYGQTRHPFQLEGLGDSRG